MYIFHIVIIISNVCSDLKKKKDQDAATAVSKTPQDKPVQQKPVTFTPAIPNDKLPDTVNTLPTPLKQIMPIVTDRLPDKTNPLLSTDDTQNIKKGEANVVPKINSVTVESATNKTSDTKTTSKKKKNRKQNKEKKKVDVKIDEVIQEPSSSDVPASANATTVKRGKMTFRDKFSTCSYCESTIEDHIRICSGCRKVCYCNSKCQKSHWKMHKKQCIYALSKDQTTG